MGPVKYLLTHPEWFRQRYLKKRPDWSGEHEYRIVVFERDPTDRPVYIPIKDALTAIIVGSRFSDAYRPCIEQICKRTAAKAFCYMYNPDPSLSPWY